MEPIPVGLGVTEGELRDRLSAFIQQRRAPADGGWLPPLEFEAVGESDERVDPHACHAALQLMASMLSGTLAGLWHLKVGATAALLAELPSLAPDLLRLEVTALSSDAQDVTITHASVRHVELSLRASGTEAPGARVEIVDCGRLNEVHCSTSHKGTLAAVRVMACPRLETFKCQNQSVTTLHFRELPALEEVDCDYCAHLECVDVSGCALLRCLYLTQCRALRQLHTENCTNLCDVTGHSSWQVVQEVKGAMSVGRGCVRGMHMGRRHV